MRIAVLGYPSIVMPTPGDIAVSTRIDSIFDAEEGVGINILYLGG